MTAAATWIVVPCFNEAERLDPTALRTLATASGSRVLIVDDGSSDATPELVAGLVACDPDVFSLLTSKGNNGKGEAVRQGLRAVLARGAGIVGYYDADMATPAAEMVRLVEVMRADDSLAVVLGSRVAMLGTTIKRSPRRHYLGRVFATASSLALGMTVYDTQCGAKVLRAGPVLDHALAAPFSSRWSFDVELLGRLRRGGDGVLGLPVSAFREVPLVQWSDVAGSKLGALDAVRAGLDLLRVGISTRRGT